LRPLSVLIFRIARNPQLSARVLAQLSQMLRTDELAPSRKPQIQSHLEHNRQVRPEIDVLLLPVVIEFDFEQIARTYCDVKNPSFN
jgi:hypothetical protein